LTNTVKSLAVFSEKTPDLTTFPHLRPLVLTPIDAILQILDQEVLKLLGALELKDFRDAALKGSVLGQKCKLFVYPGLLAYEALREFKNLLRVPVHLLEIVCAPAGLYPKGFPRGPSHIEVLIRVEAYEQLTPWSQQSKEDFQHVIIEVLAFINQHRVEYTQTAVPPLDPVPGFLKDQLVVLLAFVLKDAQNGNRVPFRRNR
jgi:hypothetical protein